MRLLPLFLLGCSAARVPNGTDEAADAPRRVIAVGDVHGDFDAARAAMRAAGVIDEQDRWAAGEAVVVQDGDQLDRGDGERLILDLFEALRDQAEAAGGEFHPLLGNHETMNAQLDLRYVTAGGFAAFADVAYDDGDPLFGSYPEGQRGRVSAFRPGGVYAKKLAEHDMILLVEDTLFVHGGVLPKHVEHGIDAINTEVKAWLAGDADEPVRWTSSDDAPVWTRVYSENTQDKDCDKLGDVLAATGAKRMVVAHTVQDTINAACDGRVWRVDVGLSAYYGGPIQALSILGDEVEVLVGER